MPTISVFYGIIVRMYFDDHAPPHFHAHCGSHSAVVRIDTLEVIDGSLPRRAFALVLEWAIENRDELRSNWALAERHERLHMIKPLE